MGTSINRNEKRRPNVSTKRWIGMAAAVLFFSMCAVVYASGGHGAERPKKVGILLVAFGSSEASAQVSFENIDRKVKAAYPNIPVRWAYTSHIIRAKLARQGKQLDAPEVALGAFPGALFRHPFEKWDDEVVAVVPGQALVHEFAADPMQVEEVPPVG